MKRRTLAVLVLAVLVVAAPAASAPAQTPKRGGTLVVGTLQEPGCLNAYLLRCHGTTAVTGFLMRVALRGAFRAGSGAVLRPDLVTNVETTKRHPFTLRYHVRPQARWSDGTPITARDFVFTHEALGAAAKELWRPDREYFERIRSVRAVDAKTVEVVLGSRSSGWRGLFPHVLPSHALQGANFSKIFLDGVSDPRTEDPIGSGPFLVESWERGRQVTFVRNPLYWGPRRAYLDRLVFRFCRRCDDMAAEQAQLLRTGQLDLVQSMGFLSAEQLRGFRRIPGVRILARPGRAWQHFDIQLGPNGHPALRRTLVRRALANGIDRRAVARAIFGPIDPKYPSTQSSVFLLGDRNYRPNWDTYRYRPAHARGLLEQAGCTRGADGIYSCDGRRLSLRFVTAAGVQPFTSVLPLVQPQLRRAGIEAVTEFSPPQTVFTRIIPSGNYDVVLFAWIRTPTDEPGDFVSLYSCGGSQNYTGYCNRRVTRNLVRATRILDRIEQARLLNSVDVQLARDVPVIPLVQNPFVVAFRGGVRGVDVRGAPYPFENAEDWWLDD